MNSYMAVATFKDGVTPEDIRALIPAEQAQAKILEDAGSLGSIKVSMTRRTVFLEVFAQTDSEVGDIVSSLPLSQLWNVDLFPTTPPAGAAL